MDVAYTVREKDVKVATAVLELLLETIVRAKRPNEGPQIRVSRLFLYS